MAHPLMCQRCQQQPRKPHFNAKYCAACAAALVHRPRSRVTPAQAAQLLPLLGTLPKAAIAQQVGISMAALTRWLREEGLHSDSKPYPPEVVTTVTAAYAVGGRRHAQELFPDVRVRSIVERHKAYSPRQVRWTDAQQIEAARMAGLVSASAQAHWFSRPNAFDGSIKALWVKRFQCAPRTVNGLPASLAWSIVHPGCPAVLVKHQQTSGTWALVLWLDLTQHLRPDVPEWVRDAVTALAQFQSWLFGTAQTEVISQMIREREA